MKKEVNSSNLRLSEKNDQSSTDSTAVIAGKKPPIVHELDRNVLRILEKDGLFKMLLANFPSSFIFNFLTFQNRSYSSYTCRNTLFFYYFKPSEFLSILNMRSTTYL